MRAIDHETFAFLRERRDGTLDQRTRPGGRSRGEQAELVAAEPVRGARRPGDVFETARQPHEQCVAGGMTEGVVVALEAVEVEEEDQQLMFFAGGREPLLQVGDQSTPIREARQLVVKSLVRKLGLGSFALRHSSELRSDVGHQVE